MLNPIRLSTRRMLPRPSTQRATTSPPGSIGAQRNFQNSAKPAYKKGQDRESIDTGSSEYTKSGTDNQAAENQEAAFDPSKTSPESQKQKAGEGNEGNPLEVSPANPEVSKPRGETEGGAEKGVEKERSGGGSPTKNGKL